MLFTYGPFFLIRWRLYGLYALGSLVLFVWALTFEFFIYIVFLKFSQDKTFGMKNKKGTKQQKFIQQINKQVKSGGDPLARKVSFKLKISKDSGLKFLTWRFKFLIHDASGLFV